MSVGGLSPENNHRPIQGADAVDADRQVFANYYVRARHIGSRARESPSHRGPLVSLARVFSR